jgi:deoxyribodipyrimidine photo-lyase
VTALVVDGERERRLARNERRNAYFRGAASSLAADLAARGARLIVRRDATPKNIVRLARETGASTVCWSAGYDAEQLDRDRTLQAELEEAGFRVSVVHDAPAVPPDETAAAKSDDDGEGYRALASYVRIWRARPRAAYASPVRFVTNLDRGAASHESFGDDVGATGGESPAVSEASVLADLDAYLDGPALAYRFARNVPGSEPTSRLSAALSFGLVSARTVAARIDARARDPFLLAEERASLDALSGALARRDFFLQLGWFFERSPDLVLQARMRDFPFARAHPALDAWLAGRTGYPLVDAGMRQLRATGWMHPRVRSIAASFLCFDLGVDWRVGRDAWDELLVEDEPALAAGNWQWTAGVGADLAQFPRIFNPRKQARFVDPAGAYVRRWIPELANLPDAAVLDPGSAARRLQLALPLFDGAAYPTPVVEHERAARAFLARYAAHAPRR